MQTFAVTFAILIFMKKEVTTLKKLAQTLGLSISTVSRALNDHPDISVQTKEKVKALALKLKVISIGRKYITRRTH